MQGNYVGGIRYKGLLLKDLEFSSERVFADYLRDGGNGYWCYTDSWNDSEALIVSEVEIREVGSNEWKSFMDVRCNYVVDRHTSMYREHYVQYMAEVETDIILGLRELDIEFYDGGDAMKKFVLGVWVKRVSVVRYGDERSYLKGLYYSISKTFIKDMRVLGCGVLKYRRDFGGVWIVSGVEKEDLDENFIDVELVEYKGFLLMAAEELGSFTEEVLDKYLEVCKSAI